MNNFKKLGGSYIDDLGHYVREYVKQYPNVVISVGCDSKQHKYNTVYGMVVAMYHPQNACHYVFTREKVGKVKDMYLRLYGEVERVLKIGEYLETELDGIYKREEEFNKLVELHLDFNPDPMYKSNVIHSVGISILKGYGYRVKTKPFAWASTVCADLICKK